MREHPSPRQRFRPSLIQTAHWRSGLPVCSLRAMNAATNLGQTSTHVNKPPLPSLPPGISYIITQTYVSCIQKRSL